MTKFYLLQTDDDHTSVDDVNPVESEVSSSIHVAVSDPRESEGESRKAKYQILMFTRVLMKYLEKRDPEMYARAKIVIRECVEKNRKKEQGFESDTVMMKKLRNTVGERNWVHAECFLRHLQKKFLEQRRNV